MVELLLDPQKTALIVIDLQNAIVGMNPLPQTAAQVVENSGSVLISFLTLPPWQATCLE